MLDADKDLTTPLVIDSFETKDIDMATQVPGCHFDRIEIVRNQTLRKLVHTNVRLLKHAIIQMANYEKELTIKCNTLILNVYKAMDLVTKTACVKYFVRYYKCSTGLDECQQAALCCILAGVKQVAKQVDVWKVHNLANQEGIREFVDAICDLLSCPCISTFTKPVLERAAKTCIQLLRGKNARDGEMRRMCQQMYKFLIVCFDHIKSVDCEKDLFNFLMSDVGSEFLASIDTNFVQRCIFVDDFGNSTLWTELNERLSALSAQNVQAQSERYRCLCSIKLMLVTAKSIEHNLVASQQMELSRNRSENLTFNEVVAKMCTVAYRDSQQETPRRLFEAFDITATNILKLLIKLIKSNECNAAHLKLATEIATTLLTLPDGQDIDTFVQMQLLLIALAPLLHVSELLRNHVALQEFAPIASTLNSLSTADKLALAELTLSLMSIFTVEHLSSNNRELLLDLMQQIAGNLNGHHELWIKVMFNLFIQDIFRIDQLATHFQTAIANGECHQSTAEGLKSYLCLSAGTCLVYQYLRNGGYRHHIQCLTCDTDHNGDELTTETLLSELEKVDGRLLRSPKQSTRQSQFKHPTSYFKLYDSADDSVRIRMNGCTPALLHHMTIDALEVENVRLWMKPVMNALPETQLQTTNNLKMVPEIVRVSCFIFLILQSISLQFFSSR